MRARTVQLEDRDKAGHIMLAQPNVSIQELLQKPEIDAQCLLHQAAKHNLVGKMKLLVDNHNVDVNGLSKHPTTHMLKVTPLMGTTESGSFAAAEWLIQHGADTNVLSHPKNESVTALWSAAENGYVRLAKLFLHAGADVNVTKASTGNTALFIAVQNGHKAMVMLLLKYGADPNKTKITSGSDNLEPIVMAVGMQRPTLVAQLINAGARIPYFCMEVLDSMRERKATLNPNSKKKVTDEEIKVLDELVHVNISLRDDSNYAKARVAERKGKYRKALRLLRAVPISCAQLTFDVERVMEHIYGVKGSDGRMSAWKNVPVMSMKRPLSLQFYAWVQVGRKIYTHGGLDFAKFIKEPELDELWELDIDTRNWTLLKTTGKTPGPRAGHTMFAFQNALYLWGGKGPGGRLMILNVQDVSDSKLYRLALDEGREGPLTWDIVKMKSSLKPPPRYEHAGVFYNGKYFITGGNLGGWDLTDDTWSLDMSSLKWTALKRGPKERHRHGMWAGNGKLYVYGGSTVDRHIEDPNLASHTIEDFVTFDIATTSWISAKVTGDRPFGISEFTVLPLYHGEDKHEGDPSSVIVWGGYNKSKGPRNEEHLKAMYGDLAQEFSIPYRNRLLRFDLKTEAWTLLLPTRELLPKALSFAAEVRSENGQTQLLIGGGYGLTGDSIIEKIEDLPKFENVSVVLGDDVVTPVASTSIFEVFIADERQMCFTRESLMEKHWAWDFFDLPGDRFPNVQAGLFPCSPTLHTGIDLTFEDFAKPPCNSVRPNDDSNLLGLRVKLNGLKGRQDLNGAVARCGYWQKEKERYQIFIPPYEYGGPASMLVKASNLLVAKPFDCTDSADIANCMSRSNCSASFPIVHMSLITAGNAKFKRRPLENVLSDTAMDYSTWNTWIDCYYGPVSAKAQVLLRTIAINNSSFESDLMCAFIPSSFIKDGPGKNTTMGKTQLKHRALFVDFYTKLKERDTLRVKNFEANILRKRIHESNTDIGSWLKLVVTMDGIEPAVWRELIVSPDISMKSLHHQVLCPAIGWSNNYHCYAFRRLRGTVDPGTRKNKATMAKAVSDAIEMLSEECWVGPKNSTAIDSMFQPLYIGGALANDKLITLGALFTFDKQDEMKLQYVHDFGDWWSHSISVVKYDGEIPSSASVAHLVSGGGNCPPDDIGGYPRYVQTMSKLTGKMEIKSEEIFEDLLDGNMSEKVDPSNERWWKYLNSEVRGKMNMQALSNPLLFDMDLTRANLEIAIRRPKQKGGKEVNNLTLCNLRTGLATSDFDEKCTVESEKSRNPLKFCAICEVTVALKTCSGCNSIAFCSREHQLQYWPKHKKDCRRIQKDKK